MINMNLLRSFRKNLKALKLSKKQYERELMSLRAEIQEHEMAIQYIERNLKKHDNIRKKNKSRRSK